MKVSKVSYEKEVTAEEVIAEAKEIWGKCKKLFPPLNSENEEKILEEIHHQMQKEHSEFAKAYPIVLRFMCETRSYDDRALKRYLSHVARNPWNSELAYFQSQAEYVRLLYKVKYPKADVSRINTIYENTVKTLQAEREHFKQTTEACADKVKQEHENMHRRNIMEIREWFAAHGADAAEVPVRGVLCDESGAEIPMDPVTDIDSIISPDDDFVDEF